MALASLSASSLPESMYRSLREAILNGEFRPGQMLRQEELARRLGASRAPLREALPRLEAEGLVIALPRRGYAVMALDPNEVRELFELRIMMDERFSRLATERRTAADVAHMRAIVERMSRLLPVTDTALSEWFEGNMAFHSALLAPAGGPHLQRVLETLRSAVEPYIRMELRLTGDCEQAQAEHMEILVAFEAGDAERVAHLAREHAEHTMDRLLSGLRGRAGQG